MTRCALIKNGVIQSVIRIDADDVLIISEDSQVGSGDLYDAKTGIFVKAPEPENGDDGLQVKRTDAPLDAFK